MKISEHIANIRLPFKQDTADVLITDRDIYGQMLVGRDLLVKRTDAKLKLMDKEHLFKPRCFELIEVPAVECCTECVKIKSDCKIKRTKHKLPEIVKGEVGPIIFYVSSLDGSTEVSNTNKMSYVRKLQKSTHKYDKSRYYWMEDDYIYFPDIPWQSVLVSAYWTEDEEDSEDGVAGCKDFQDREFLIPEDLAEPLYRMVWERLGLRVQTQDQVVNKVESN